MSHGEKKGLCVKQTFKIVFLILAAAALLVAPSTAFAEPSSAFKMLLAGSVTAHAADLGSTLYALQQPGTREANPVYSLWENSPLTISATKAGMVGVSTWGKIELYKRHPKAAWIWVVAETAALTWVATHNYGLVSAR